MPKITTKLLNETHQVFQGGALDKEVERIHTPGYNHLPPWNTSNWRYNPATGQEIVIEDGHGRRMNGN
ncbi:TPA: hypothetical protein HA371_07045 [Candidatus Woesearchaeota archaeon]|nr:hypothetical protein [Candidatus Woesearchaeota archaeon]